MNRAKTSSLLFLLITVFSANNAIAQQQCSNHAIRFAQGGYVAHLAQSETPTNGPTLVGKWHGACGELQVTQTGDDVVLHSDSRVYTGRLSGNTVTGTWVSRESLMSGKFEFTYQPTKDRLLGWYSVELNNGTADENRSFYAERGR